MAGLEIATRLQTLQPKQTPNAASAPNEMELFDEQEWKALLPTNDEGSMFHAARLLMDRPFGCWGACTH